MSDTSGLAEFLLARIAEDEAGPWEHWWDESQYHRCRAIREPEYAGDLEVGEEFCDCGMPRLRARVLAECDAKRRIVELYQFAPPASDPFMDQVILLLALPYADRPGYREEWKP